MSDRPQLLFSNDEHAYIIAEIGSNHDGDKTRALDLIRLAAEAGADAAKFQLFRAETLVVPSHPAFAKLSELAVPMEWLPELVQACREHSIHFSAAPFDLASVAALVEHGADWIKIASSDITYLALLERCGATGLPLVVSTGMSTMEEVSWALGKLRATGSTAPIALLHCVSKYPPDFSDMNLAVIPVLARKFGLPVGLSDHTPGSAACLGSYTLGARIFEKHLTDDRTRNGPDHPYALEPAELANLVQGLRNLQAALGDGVKRPMAEEEQIRIKARRGLFAARALEAGIELGPEDLIALRPTGDVNAEDQASVLGTRLRSPLRAFEALPADLLSKED